MEIAAALIATVLLTIAAIAISRAGGDEHQEELNEHDTAYGAGRAVDEGRPAEPKTDRPAGPDAEAMGVAEAGEPSTDPESQLEAERLADRSHRR